jgi:hypothetical protein
MFGKIKEGANGEISRNNNFQTFTQALLVLFRSSTGKNIGLKKKIMEFE